MDHPFSSVATLVARRRLIYTHCEPPTTLHLRSRSCACAWCRLCNRVRAKLPDDEKANLDKVLALLAPLFELGSDHPSDTSHGGAAEAAELPALTRGHAVIADLAAAGRWGRVVLIAVLCFVAGRLFPTSMPHPWRRPPSVMQLAVGSAPQQRDCSSPMPYGALLSCRLCSGRCHGS